MSPEYRVLITDRPWSESDIEREILADVGVEVVEAPDSDEATLIEAVRDCDAIATCWAKVTAGVIQAAERCRHVARMGIGLDNIAVDEATRRGIPVTNVPDYCVSEVSDHALALILACARNIGFFHGRTKQGEYDLAAAGSMRRLSECTLGLVGLGHTARALVPKARALGMTVIATTPSGNDYGTGCRMVSFEEVLEKGDFISVHAPLTEATRHLFDAAAFERMKPSAYLINTARGGLIDESAMWDSLKAGQIAGAGLDVFDPEPPDLDRPLFRDERVIVTPHAAFVSRESVVELRQRVAKQIAAVLSGERPASVVNPEVYDDHAAKDGGD
ncbi:D-3-phosphoglycerate dehydrogenase [Maioricimonas rarisocia]|uniref:D-3-phosphoglycerate dehydrogenase n=1 Tax=Maioricimonas rarisocia TaxID=2528026 RepID=A0A517Z490_9PLAN|nr:C-terminal binding protein [Maioricimonas rarisocia]QDU37300.1 D-3-phosphoglycerate dehydrogenase [Maioricimonas rarisocia]